MALEAFEKRPLICDQAEVLRAGVLMTLDRDGSLAVYRGYVRPEDESREEAAVQDAQGAGVMGQGADAMGSGWQSSTTSVGGTVITLGGQPIGADASGEVDDRSDVQYLLQKQILGSCIPWHERASGVLCGVYSGGDRERSCRRDRHSQPSLDEVS
jgi:hypothetical protein